MHKNNKIKEKTCIASTKEQRKKDDSSIYHRLEVSSERIVKQIGIINFILMICAPRVLSLSQFEWVARRETQHTDRYRREGNTYVRGI